MTPFQLASFFAAALFVLFLRQTGALLHPQMCCEDGKFYSEAYSLGWLRALPLPNAGYLDVEPRLVAAIALLVPLPWVPLLENLFGFTFQILPSLYLLSNRNVTWGPLHIRALMAGMYILMTNTGAVHVFSLNSQWHLAVLAPLIAFSDASKPRLQLAFDLLLLILATLSGPFCLVLLPFSVYYAWTSGKRSVWLRAAIVACAVAAQILIMVRNPRPTEAVLGASVSTLARIIGGDVFLATVFGGRFPFATHLPMFLIVLAVAAGAMIVYTGNRVAPRAERLFTLYTFLLLGASLYKTFPTYPYPAWVFWMHAHGQRYYFLPVVACTFSLLWAALGPDAKGMGKKVAIIALGLLPVGVALDFVHPNLRQAEFAEKAAVFEAAPKGQTVEIPIYPGRGWQMELKKH